MQSLLIHQMRLLQTAIPLLLLVAFGSAQQKPSQGNTSQEPDDIVRVSAELVQTGVTVLDKQGRVVEGLQREQFELYINGKAQPISLFDSVATGSRKEDARIGSGAAGSIETKSDVSSPGRRVFFFIDDLHLAANSIYRVRLSLLHFINEMMVRNDQAAIVSASGQIGFLQQLTGNKAVLKAAVERLAPIPYKVRDSDRPPISEYAALMIEERHDRDVFNYFVEQTMKVNRMEASERPIAASMVESRARLTLRQSDAANKNALLTLGSLVRSAARLPGRKTVFFLSDGFVLNLTGSDIAEAMRRLTDEAVRANTVIYTIDARGLSIDSQFDASNGGGADTTGVLSRVTSSEHAFSQEGLYALAADTGGRALLNSNSLTDGIDRALQETSVYYILAWKPSNDSQRDSKFHQIAVKVAGRPDLKVLVQRGYFSEPDKSTIKELPGFSSSIRSYNQLPIRLNLAYGRESGNRMLLTASVRFDRAALMRDVPNGRQDVDLELMGAVIDSRGKPVGSFLKKININFASSNYDPIFKYLLRVPPGLYQVRVAAVNAKAKRLGDAAEWIEITAN